MTNVTLKQIINDSAGFFKVLTNSLTLQNSGTQESIEKALAVLTLAIDIMEDAYDIEHVYNAKKLFDYAFSDNRLQRVLKENRYLSESKRKFELVYETKNLIRHCELNQEHAQSMLGHLRDTKRRLQFEDFDKDSAAKYREYAMNNKVDFINYSRNI